MFQYTIFKTVSYQFNFLI